MDSNLTRKFTLVNVLSDLSLDPLMTHSIVVTGSQKLSPLIQYLEVEMLTAEDILISVL